MSDDFVVHDKRLFTKDGQVNPDSADDDEKSPPNLEQEPPADAAGAQNASTPLPPANFTGLLIGLATSAFIHLGESPDGVGQGAVDLPAAKHSIDLLAVLQAKTQGNLEKEENALLSTLLYDLRLKYVQATNK